MHFLPYKHTAYERSKTIHTRLVKPSLYTQFTSAHLHIFTFAHLLICTFPTASPLHPQTTIHHKYA